MTGLSPQRSRTLLIFWRNQLMFERREALQMVNVGRLDYPLEVFGD